VTPAALPGLRYWRLWMLCGVGLVLVITWLSLAPLEQLPEVKMSDKLEHMLAYVALAFWFGSLTARRSLGWVALALMGYGALIELFQDGMQWGRQGDVRDLGANALGIAAGLLLVLTPLGRWARWLESQLRQTA
jgi:VanZ family protein